MVYVSIDKGKGMDTVEKSDKAVTYNGEKIVIKL